MIFNATVAVIKEEKWYVAKCIDNRVASQGETIEEALSNLKEALELYYEDYEQLPIANQTFITSMEIAI